MGVGYEQKDYLQVFESLIYYLLHLPNEKKILIHQMYRQCTRDLKFKDAV